MNVCDVCGNGVANSQRELSEQIEKAKKYVEENNKPVIIYKNEEGYGFAAVEWFYATSPGKPIEQITPQM